MRTFLPILGSLLLALLFAVGRAEAQPGVKKPARPSATNTPARPSTTRSSVGAAAPPSKPSAGRFSDDPSEEPDGGYYEPQETAPPPRGGARFVAPPDDNEPEMEEPEEDTPPREDFRSASRENRSIRREPAARINMREEEPMTATDARNAPAPFEQRGGARSVDAQPIQITLNDTEAGVVLSSALNLDHERAITGYPIRLEQVIAASPDTQARRIAVRAYWNLVISIADYHFALDEFDLISQVAARQDDPLIEAASAAAEARVAETHLTAMAAQFDLAAFSPSATALPIPADAPLIGDYRTEYQALFGNGPAPIAIRRLAAMLPLYRTQVAARGRAVFAASNAMQRNDDLTTFKELCTHRRAFLGAVRDYNEAIADYALQLTAPGTPVDVVTSMLIVRATPPADAAPSLSATGARSASVVRASAAEPIDSPAEKVASKPRRNGGFRSAEESEPLGPDDGEENGQVELEPEEPDATESPARGGGRFRFEPSSGDDE